MGFQNMYMAMIIAKVTRERLLISSAGMPFTYYYRVADNKVAEIALKGLPLGGFPDFPYQSVDMALHKGDTFLLMSDGLMELRNENGEFFEEERIKSLFLEVALEPPATIIEHLSRAAEEWTEMKKVQDDMTLMVVKVK
jgi:serine phosphatase RsbU (regulator of sigma subunit)